MVKTAKEAKASGEVYGKVQEKVANDPAFAKLYDTRLPLPS
jgi:hypothetical protein